VSNATDHRKLAGKVVVVTGAAQGIGRAIAERCADEGADVVLVDRNETTLSATVDALQARDSDHYVGRGAARFSLIAGDIADEGTVRNMIDTAVNSHGRLDGLVNNAGIFGAYNRFENNSIELFEQMIAVNVRAAWLAIQYAKPAMLASEGGGAIVNIASISGLRASTLRVAYGTSKAAVIQLTKQQAVELGEFGVRANCVCPGPVRTKLAMAVHSQAIIDAYHDAIPLNRYGSETEIAEAIHFLASPRASYITGQVLAADGGFEATGVGLPDLRV